MKEKLFIFSAYQNSFQLENFRLEIKIIKVSTKFGKMWIFVKPGKNIEFFHQHYFEVWIILVYFRIIIF